MAKQPELEASASDLKRFLDVIEREIWPKTVGNVAKGNKVFGAAILTPGLETVAADSNHETENPLFHGEVYVIHKWSEQTSPAERGATVKEAVFLSTHEPCCMCISSIVWAGFKKVYYFFPYEATSAQGIPYDIEIMHELWKVPSYARQNKYCSTACIVDLIEALPDGAEKDDLKAAVQRITKGYNELSDKYHSEKGDNPDNNLSFA